MVKVAPSLFVLLLAACSETPLALTPTSPTIESQAVVVGAVRVIKPPPVLKIKLLEDACLRIYSSEEQVIRVVWDSEIGGVYRKDFTVKGWRRLNPGCFHHGRYRIHVGSTWHRSIDYGPGMTYCY